MPLNEGAVNEIMQFCANGIESTNPHGDLFTLAAYAACIERLRGNQPGIAKRAPINRALRQSLHVASGVAQFIANRYEDGVRDNNNLDKIEDGLVQAIRKIAMVVSSASGGILPWKPDTTYNPLPHIVWASDNMLYVAEQPSGPGTAAGPQDPTTTTGYWLTLGKYISGGSGGGGQIFPGKIDFLANRYDELPPGYYACYGARYALATPQGQVLQSLPPTLRSTLKITITAAGINVPQMIVSGKGYFVRAVDGITRLPGSIEQDAARAITITGDVSGTLGSVIMTGAATGSFSATRVGALYADGSYPAAAQNVSLNGSITLSQENVGTENRPINIGMTPVIYLGV